MRTAARTPQRSRNRNGEKAVKTTPVPAQLAQKRQLAKSVAWTGREQLQYRWNRLRRTPQEVNCATPPDGRPAGALDIQRPPLARLGLLALLALAVGCSSSSTSGTSASSAAPAASTPAAAHIFRSHHYAYTETLPTGWYSNGQARQRWDGTGAPGAEDSVVDLFTVPGGVEAWAVAAPTKESLAAYARATIRAAHAAHPCPAAPQTNQAITIGGAPARLLGMHCPAGSGFLVEIAVTIRHGAAFVFASQNPSGTTPADRAAFRRFLAGITFPR
jgi:hypothetical protein